MIGVTASEMRIVHDILHRLAPDCEARVFGSRYRGIQRQYSDLDIALVGLDKLEFARLGAISCAFEESDLPFRIDILDWHRLSKEFQAVIERGYTVIHTPR